jgi:ubiquinone/menaquinone biosynthesis C-methylase UbiE
MQAKLQRRIQRYGWDKAVDEYEPHWQQQLEPAQTRMLDMADIQPGEWVLDVACGTGLVSCRAASQVGIDGVVVGTDLADNMVKRAHQSARQQGFLQAIFTRMDAETLQLSPGTFDVALCALGLMYVPGPLRALQEMYRVLKPGGRVAVAVWGQRAHCGWAEIFPIVEARVRSDVCPLFFQLGAQQTLARTLQSAGFQDVEDERLSTILHYDTPESACGAAFAGGPVALAYSRFDATMRVEAHVAYLDSIAAYRSAWGYDVPGEFVIARGSKSCIHHTQGPCRTGHLSTPQEGRRGSPRREASSLQSEESHGSHIRQGGAVRQLRDLSPYW